MDQAMYMLVIHQDICEEDVAQSKHADPGGSD